jgi:hypothetical protein
MKKRILCILLVGIMIFSLLGFTEGVKTETYTKTEKGFGGDVTVTVTLENGVITAVKAEGPKETPGVGGKAIAQLPALIVKASGRQTAKYFIPGKDADDPEIIKRNAGAHVRPLRGRDIIDRQIPGRMFTSTAQVAYAFQILYDLRKPL